MMYRLLTGLGVALTLLSAAVLAAPLGYTINSDSQSEEPAIPDSLYVIDLADASSSRIGQVLPSSDIEGMAFNTAGELFAVDDASLTLFEINPDTGSRDLSSVKVINGLTPGNNDFGMTFSCSGTLYASSRANQSLYRINPDNGLASLVGALGAGIVAMTSRGSADAIWGVTTGDSAMLDTTGRRLFRIDPATAAVTEVGFLEVDPYREAGLGFDADGNLWMITDRVQVDQSLEALPSQIWQIDPDTAAATFVGTTTIQGAESLAVAPPSACGAPAPAPPPTIPPPANSAVPIPTLSDYALWLLLGLTLLMGGIRLARQH